MARQRGHRKPPADSTRWSPTAASTESPPRTTGRAGTPSTRATPASTSSTPAWDPTNLGRGSQYQDDYDTHWAPGAQHDEYTWLRHDLAAHPRELKFAVFHYPLHSDQTSQPSDSYLDEVPASPGRAAQPVPRGDRVQRPRPYLPAQHCTARRRHQLRHRRRGRRLDEDRRSGCAPTDAYGIGWDPVHPHGQQVRPRAHANLRDPGVPFPAGHRE